MPDGGVRGRSGGSALSALPAALTLPKFLDAITQNKNVEETQRGQVMELTQAFLLGIMVAWTPSLIVLAVLLRDVR